MGSYPALATVRKDLKVRWYRTRIEPALLRSLTARSNVRGFAQTIGHFILYLGTGSVAFWLWSVSMWWAFPIALLAHGVVASFLRGISTHELAHGTVFRTKGLNRLFLYVFSLLNWWNHVDYAMSHTYHHRFTLHPNGDREVLLPLKPMPGPWAVLQLFTANLFLKPSRTFSSGGLFPTVFRYIKSAFGITDRSRAPSSEWIRALHQEHPSEAARSAWWCRATLVFHAGIIAVSVATGLWVLPILVTVAPFIASFALYAVGLPQHCGLKDRSTDFRKCARSIRLGPILSFLYWQMNWHTEHHMYAAVPCYRLRRLAQSIADDMPEPRSLAAAWKEMRMIWREQQSDPSFQFDLPLPASAVREDTDPKVGGNRSADDDLDRSLGELEPDGLV